MTDILDAFKAEFIKAAPALVAALVALILAGFGWLQKRMSLVRAEVAASAVRQAQQLHVSDAAVFQAATDELHKMSPKVRPKDVAQAVEKAVDKDRVARASLAPAAGIVAGSPIPTVVEARAAERGQYHDDEDGE
ncbi:MAG TPA: hypothetical protein VK509_07530 [Polyangiales bacterium]|nr:hypothetical protein [Polyangiales bacterium]